MKYTLDVNGKERTITIPNEEIQRSMKSLGLNQTQAIKMWLEDNELEINEEQEKLVQETKNVKMYVQGEKPRKKRTVVKKVDEDKKNLISFLEQSLLEKVENATITNDQKIIEFDYNGSHYKLDLIKQRKPKK